MAVVCSGGMRWYIVVVCGGGIGFRALADPLLNKLYYIYFISILVSYIMSYIDCEVLLYKEYNIGLILAVE